IQTEEPRLIVSGEVVTAELRTLRAGRRLLQFDLSDRTDALAAKCFLDPDEPDPSGIVKPGAWLLVRGAVQYDRYTGELCLQADDILAGERPQREDGAAEKRVELHLHSKMSQMDSVLDIGKAVAQAAAWGRDAIAVTDHGVVQAFP